MRTTILALVTGCFLACASVSASVWQFDLGGRAVTGAFSGLNEVPANASAASGFELPPGISYNDSLDQLTIHIGWGDDPSVGGVDLESAFAHAYIQAPGSVNGTGAVIYTLDLIGGYTPLDGEGRSGTIHMSPLTLFPSESYTVAQQENDLTNGLWYINIATTDRPGGEIRGQLVPVPEPEAYALVSGGATLAFMIFRRFRTRSARS